MTDTNHLLLIGASVRAAAFSALRAGLSPWCIDLFADADLVAACPTQRLTTRYPDGFEDLLAKGPPGPWLYTGGLENHPRLVDRLARQRPLWGNPARSLEVCRDPLFLSRILRAEGLPVPECQLAYTNSHNGKRWLAKPLRGAGGAGVRFLERRQTIRPGEYVQEYVEGEACSVVFVGAGPTTRMLGLTQQLVGVNWLHARPFHYCGSIGPLPVTGDLSDQLDRLGSTLARECHLVGLFGVDGILRDGLFWPVEVNPRYTASVEVIEYATGVCALDWHRLACTGRTLPKGTVPAASQVVGKAIVFATRDVVFPVHGPWGKAVNSSSDPWHLPSYADIPTAGFLLRANHPVLSTFASAGPTLEVLDNLRQTVREVDAALGNG